MMRAILLALFALFVLTAPAVAAPAHVQSCANEPSSGSNTSLTCTFSSNITAGDAILCYATNDSSSSQTTSAVKDGNSNSLTIQDQVNDTPNQQNSADAWIANDPGGTTTVTATYSASAAGTGIACDEYSGVATSSALDGHTMQAQASAPGTTNGVTSGNITTTVNGDLIWGATTDNNGFVSVTAGTGFTARNNSSGGSTESQVTEDQVQSSSGSIAATFTLVTGGNSMTSGVIALKAAGAASTPHLLLLLGVGE